MDRNQVLGARPRAVITGLAFALALAVPAGANAATTVTLGPTLPTGTGISEGCAFEHPDCTHMNTALPTGLLAKAKAAGTIVKWKVEAFQGSAKLLVVKPIAGGKFSIVARSAEVHKPCVRGSVGCFPPTGGVVYTFPTKLAIAAGDFIAIELLSPANCNTSPDDDLCSDIGLFDGFVGKPFKATNQYFDPTPRSSAASAPNNLGGKPSAGGIMLDAIEQLGKATPKPKPKPKKKPKPKPKKKPKPKPKKKPKPKGGAVNVSGKWKGGVSGPYSQVDTLVENTKTGTFAGSGTATNGTGYTWPNHGTVKGKSVHWVQGPYKQLKTYTAICNGTLSANGKTITGTCSDNSGHSGLAWKMTKT